MWDGRATTTTTIISFFCNSRDKHGEKTSITANSLTMLVIHFIVLHSNLILWYPHRTSKLHDYGLDTSSTLLHQVFLSVLCIFISFWLFCTLQGFLSVWSLLLIQQASYWTTLMYYLFIMHANKYSVHMSGWCHWKLGSFIPKYQERGSQCRGPATCNWVIKVWSSYAV